MKGLFKKIAVSTLTLFAATLIGFGVNTVQTVEKANAANVNTTVTEDNFRVYSAALRMVEYEYTPAVRYRIAMEKTTFENNYALNGELDQQLTTGILLAKKSVLGNNTLTMENAGASAETTTWWKEDVCMLDTNGDGALEEVACMVSSMFVYNIPQSDFGVNLVARAYITYNGVTTYSKQTGGVSLSWVAHQTYADKLGDNGALDESDYTTDAEGNSVLKGLTYDETKVLESVRDTYCKYTLNYYVDNAVAESGTAYYGEKLPQPETPTSSSIGEFLGWYNRTGTVKWEFATQTVLGATNLYAKFALANPYNVTFDLQSTTTEPAYLSNEYKTSTGYATEYKGVALKLPTPERYGYRFLGWYNAATGGSKVSDTFSCSKDTTLYARWSSTCYLWLYYGERSTDYVRFEYQVGDVVSIEDLNKLYPESLTLNTTKLGLPYVANIEYWAYENDTINETYSKIESDITFYKDKSEVIVIARYGNYLAHLEYTQESKEDYLADSDFDTAPSYITTGKVEYVFVDKDAVAGTYSMTLSWVKGQVTSGSFGPAFRMDPIAHDYQYETKGAACSNYLSVVVGPTTGNTGIYRVVDGKWSRVCDDLAVSGDWKTYYTSVQNGATITLTMQIVVSANGFDVVYKFNDKTQSIYSTTMDLTPYLGTGFGLRSSSTGVTVSNVTYEPSYVKVVQFYSQGTLLSTQYTAPNGGTVAFPATPTKEGYTKYNGNVVSYEFIGWYTENNEKVTEARKFIRDTKLTARFKPVETRNGALVTYDSQGDVIYTFSGDRKTQRGIVFDGITLPESGEFEYSLNVEKWYNNTKDDNVPDLYVDFIYLVENPTNILNYVGSDGQDAAFIRFNLCTGTLTFNARVAGKSHQNHTLTYNNILDKENCQFYKDFGAYKAGASLDLKVRIVYGKNAKGEAVVKAYFNDSLIYVCGLTDAEVDEPVHGGFVGYVNRPEPDTDQKACYDYLANPLGYGLGVWFWEDISVHGNITVSDIYATRVKNGITVTKDTNGNDVWSVTGDRSTLHGVIIGEGYENGVFEHRLSVDDMPAGESYKNYRTLFFAEEGTSASFTGTAGNNQASLWVNFQVGYGTLIFGSKIFGTSVNNYELTLNSINPESSYYQYYNAKSKAAKASSEPVAAAFDIKVVYGLDENGYGWVKYYMKGDTDSVYSLLFTYGLTKADLNGEVCHGKMCTDVNYSTDNSVFLSYVKGGKMGTKVGFCSWAGGTDSKTGAAIPYFEYKVSNVSISELKTQDNGFTIRKDGSYVSIVCGDKESTGSAGVTTVNSVQSTRYGLWESDVTMNKAAILSNSRIGLFISAYVPDTDDYLVWSDSRVNGYLLFHNPNANVAFGFSREINGSWIRWSNISYASADSFTLSNSNAAYAEVKEYYEAVEAVKNGDKESVTVRLGFEYTKTALRIYVGGKLYAEYTGEDQLHLFDGNADCYQVGFLSGGDTIFSNYRFTPYTENA